MIPEEVLTHEPKILTGLFGSDRPRPTRPLGAPRPAPLPGSRPIGPAAIPRFTPCNKRKTGRLSNSNER